jgi:hypothetical protein
MKTMQTLTMKFTADEVRGIEKAAKICGWRKRESGRFARTFLLRMVREVLRRPQTKKEGPA